MRAAVHGVAADGILPSGWLAMGQTAWTSTAAAPRGSVGAAANGGRPHPPKATSTKVVAKGCSIVDPLAGFAGGENLGGLGGRRTGPGSRDLGLDLVANQDPARLFCRSAVGRGLREFKRDMGLLRRAIQLSRLHQGPAPVRQRRIRKRARQWLCSGSHETGHCR